jgi:L-fucose isomerase-like protein
MKVFLKSIVSSFHDDDRIDKTTLSFNESLNNNLKKMGIKLVDEGDADLTIYYIKSGGTENIFKNVFKPQDINLLLTTTMHNSLPAALEIHSYLTDLDYNVEILHGNPEYIAQRIYVFAKIMETKRKLKTDKLGVIGAPSDWLIASDVDYDRINEIFGIELIDISLDEFYKVWEEFEHLSSSTPYDDEEIVKEYDQEKVSESNRIYKALKVLINKYGLTALTLRCFDLVNNGCGTGCLALSYLNSENIISGCEGDIPSAISMLIMNRLTDESVFMSNPSRIDMDNNTVLFAHCTLPWDMSDDKELDTHFETGLGIGVRGYIRKGDVTVFKLGKDGDQYFVSDGKLLQAGNEDVLCRTQATIALENDVRYFLKNPLGNHHLICKGSYGELIQEFFENL